MHDIRVRCTMNIDVIPRIVRRALVSLLHLLANYMQNVREED